MKGGSIAGRGGTRVPGENPWWQASENVTYWSFSIGTLRFIYNIYYNTHADSWEKTPDDKLQKMPHTKTFPLEHWDICTTFIYYITHMQTGGKTTHNLSCVSSQGMVTFAVHSAPQFACLVKRPCNDLVSANVSLELWQTTGVKTRKLEDVCLYSLCYYNRRATGRW